MTKRALRMVDVADAMYAEQIHERQRRCERQWLPSTKLVNRLIELQDKRIGNQRIGDALCEMIYKARQTDITCTRYRSLCHELANKRLLGDDPTAVNVNIKRMLLEYDRKRNEEFHSERIFLRDGSVGGTFIFPKAQDTSHRQWRSYSVPTTPSRSTRT